MLIFVLALIEYLGVGVVFTNFTMLFKSNQIAALLHASTDERMRCFGLILAMTPFVQLFASPVLGRLSDRWGRRPLILFGAAMSFIGFLLTAIAIIMHSLLGLFIARFFSGVSASNIGVLQSTMADITSQQKRAGGFNILIIATGLGLSVGPAIGGVVADPAVMSWFNFATPFWMLSLVSLLTASVLFFCFQETARVRPQESLKFKRYWFQDFGRLITNANVKWLLISWMLFMGGWSLYESFFNNYVAEYLHFDLKQLGLLSTFIGVVTLVYQILLVQPLTSRFTPIRVLKVCGLWLGLSIMLMSMVDAREALLLVLIVYAGFMAFFMPNILAAVSNQMAKSSQGSVMGVVAALRAIAGIVVLIVGGDLAGVSAKAPLLFGGLIIVFSWVIIMILNNNHKENES